MRYSSIDLLRTIAIVVMVFVHFAENLSGIQLPITGLGAPLFAFLSGLSYRLWVDGLEANGTSEEEISKRSIRRGFFVFAVGFAFNIFVWLPEDTYNWDVLTMIGFSLLALNVLRRLPLAIPILVAVVSILVSPLLREMAGYQDYWKSGYFEVDLTLPDIMIGFFATGYFPLFPWMAHSIVGLVAGTLLAREQPVVCLEQSVESRDGSESFLSKAISNGLLPVFMGCTLITISCVLLAAKPWLPKGLATRFLGGWYMFPPTVEYVIATIGMATLLFGLTHRWVDRYRSRLFTDGMKETTKLCSRYSFTIYVLHHMAHLWPMWIYGYATGHETTYYWGKAMSLSWSVPLAILFLAICYFVLRLIGPDRRLGIESWMRWLCD